MLVPYSSNLDTSTLQDTAPAEAGSKLSNGTGFEKERRAAVARHRSILLPFAGLEGDEADLVDLDIFCAPCRNMLLKLECGTLSVKACESLCQCVTSSVRPPLCHLAMPGSVQQPRCCSFQWFLCQSSIMEPPSLYSPAISKSLCHAGLLKEGAQVGITHSLLGPLYSDVRVLAAAIIAMHRISIRSKSARTSKT